jgi:hypothetical protein
MFIYIVCFTCIWMEYRLNYHEVRYVLYLKFDTNSHLSTRFYGGFVHYLLFNWLFSPWYNWKRLNWCFTTITHSQPKQCKLQTISLFWVISILFMKKWTIIWDVCSYTNILWKLVSVNASTCVTVTVHFTLQLGPICHLPIPDLILNSKVLLEISSPMWKLLHWYMQYRSLYFTPRTYSDFLQCHCVLSTKLLTNCLFKESSYLSNSLRKISTPCWKVLPLAHRWQTMVLAIIF